MGRLIRLIDTATFAGFGGADLTDALRSSCSGTPESSSDFVTVGILRGEGGRLGAGTRAGDGVRPALIAGQPANSGPGNCKGKDRSMSMSKSMRKGLPRKSGASSEGASLQADAAPAASREQRRAIVLAAGATDRGIAP